MSAGVEIPHRTQTLGHLWYFDGLGATGVHEYGREPGERLATVRSFVMHTLAVKQANVTLRPAARERLEGLGVDCELSQWGTG